MHRGTLAWSRGVLKQQRAVQNEHNLAGNVTKLTCMYDYKDHWWHSGITYKESFCHMSLALRLAQQQGYAASVMRAEKILLS